MEQRTPMNTTNPSACGTRVRRGRIRTWTVILFAWALAVAAGAVTPQFQSDCEALTKTPHRLAGTVEGRSAGDYILKRLHEIGVEQVYEHEFPVAIPAMKEDSCSLVVHEPSGDHTLPLLPARPNMNISPVTPPEGITGPLISVGMGDPADFEGKDLAGAIAVCDYNAGNGWIRAFRLGAKAVIFLRSDDPLATSPHFLSSYVNVPRFYYDGPLSDLPVGNSATVTSAIPWTGGEGRNIFAWIPGTSPVFDQQADEVIVLAAPYDTYGEVPLRTPGARPAANCAALLEMAEKFHTNPPKRDILIAFFDAQGQCHMGSRAFYTILETTDNTARLDTRVDQYESERPFLEGLSKLLAEKDPLATNSPIRRNLLDRLDEKAQENSFLIGEKLYDLRVKRNTLTDKEEALQKEMTKSIEDLQVQKTYWSQLRRAIARDDFSKIPPETRRCRDLVLDEVGRDVRIRQGELVTMGRELEQEKALHKLLIDKFIVLHASLLLDDNSTRWALVTGGESQLHSVKDELGLYGKVQTAFLRAYEALEKKNAAPAHFEVDSANGRIDPLRLFVAAPFFTHSGEAAGIMGFFNLAFATTQTPLIREGTPNDTLSRLNLDNIETQTQEIYALANECANDEDISLNRAIPANSAYVVTEFANNRAQGAMVMGKMLGSSLPNKPLKGAIIDLLPVPSIDAPGAYTNADWMLKKAIGMQDSFWIRTDHNGAYEVRLMPTTQDASGGGYWWHNDTFVAAFDERGMATSAQGADSTRTLIDRLNTFPCSSGWIPSPPLFRARMGAMVMGAQNNAALQTDRSYTAVRDGFASWYSETKVDGIKLFNIAGVTTLINGPEALVESKNENKTLADADGVGFPTNKSVPSMLVALRSASDVWRLDESRMQLLRDRGIVNRSIEELHGKAEDLIYEAAAAKKTSPSTAESLAASSLMIQNRVYDQARSTLNDLVKAVLILLALAVPFAFAVERLLIGATSIYKQVLWFVVFFAIVFVLLYLTHPAFAIADTPIIIFLGFAVVVLSALVIILIMQKFKIELKVLQGMTSTVHATDVSRMSTVLAAMSMGISTMRRRPLRTAMTTFTIILLTFTILCFASFDQQQGIVTLFAAPAPAYTGVSLHYPGWGVLNEPLVDVVRARWGKETTVAERRWISPFTRLSRGPFLTRTDGTKPLVMRGLMGLSPDEFRYRDDLKKALKIDGTNFDNQVLFTSTVAEYLGVKEGDEVVVSGVKLKVGPALNATELTVLTDMDGKSALPVDFAAQSSSSSSSQTDAAMANSSSLEESQSFGSLPPDAIAIVSTKTAKALGASLYNIILYTKDSREAVSIGEELAAMLDLAVVATRQDGVYRHVLGTVLAASGVRDLLFPVLLGGLVIFGTMLGSVADREREIYTFSALGLAPPHVASLFFSEAMVYSVIGGLGGYLVAQGVMYILTILASYGLVRVPEMNYSSTNAIFTILIVMLTVLMSAIYPAIKASRSANPGILRSWKLPPADKDCLEIMFPFTVSDYDITGVVSFLKEHFDNFQDAGLGVFMSRDAKLIWGGSEGLGLESHVTLAPFDLGVTQSFVLRSAASEIPGIDEVKITINRLSGQPKDWYRLNKVLLDDLRKQFLIWRSLPHEAMETYRHRTLAIMGRTYDTAPKTTIESQANPA
jgi:hypothetical protein